ncbi:MAG: hypothetical protein ACO1Q7_18640 [Gemmatimonas sp.]
MPESETPSTIPPEQRAPALNAPALNARNTAMLAITIVALALFIRELVTAPLQNRVTLQQCLDGFSQATTASDSSTVAYLRYTDARSGKRAMCGDLLKVVVQKL